MAKDIAADFQRAVAAHQAGNLYDAEKGYRKVLKHRPDFASGHVNLGMVLQAGARLELAAQAFERAVRLQPKLAPALAGLGSVQRDLGRRDDSLATFKQAYAAAPTDIVILNNLALLLIELERFDEAIACLLQGLRTVPNHPAILTNIGNCCSKQRRYHEAIEWYEKALAADPKSAESRGNLGIALFQLGRSVEAIEVFRRAIADGWPFGLFHIGVALSDLGRISEALDTFEIASRQVQFDARMITTRALIQLKAGQLVAGWDAYESRLFDHQDRVKTHKARYVTPPPYWNGEDLSGKRLFVWTEQGLGDQVIFANMLPDVIGRAASVDFDSKPRLRNVFARSFPAARVVADAVDQGRIREAGRYDFQTSAVSMARFLRRDFGSFPRHTGYLTADPEKVDRFRRKYAALAQGRRVVGISWRSQNESHGPAKSADLSDWGDVLEVPGVWWVSLQYGDCTAELAAVKAKLGVEVYQDAEVDPMGDLDDFFAQVAALDLLVSTSNTAVHVAGSLNVPAWVLLPRGGGSMWYWFLDRSDSPWYPSVRLFREIEERVAARPWWRTVTAQVGAELKSWAGHGKAECDEADHVR